MICITVLLMREHNPSLLVGGKDVKITTCFSVSYPVRHTAHTTVGHKESDSTCPTRPNALVLFGSFTDTPIAQTHCQTPIAFELNDC
jgi:hypothetical protein